MKINDIIFNPNAKNFKCIEVIHDGKRFRYDTDDEGLESFDILYLKSDYFKIFFLHKDKIPKKYNDMLQFLKDELSRIDWESVRVMNILEIN